MTRAAAKCSGKPNIGSVRFRDQVTTPKPFSKRENILVFGILVVFQFCSQLESGDIAARDEVTACQALQRAIEQIILFGNQRVSCFPSSWRTRTK